jgi:predicted DCC family thiol-disulfide oxidoreductase YuxK
MSGADEERRALLLWDGGCAFCRRCVEWVQARDHAGRLRAIPYQEAPSPPMTEALRAACARAVHLILPDGRVLAAGRAVLGVLALLGFRRTAALLSCHPLVWLAEAGYWVAARNRGRLGRWLGGRGRKPA